MDYFFTPAICRALQEASLWRFSDRTEGVSPEAVLLGLLAEPESRAAEELGRAKIDEEAIQKHWPQIHRAEGTPVETSVDETPWRFSSELRTAVATVVDRLALFPQPLEIATEHLLLGLVAAPNEAGAWLRERGLDPEAMTVELFALYGVNREVQPLECEGLDIPTGLEPEETPPEESPRDDPMAVESEVGEPVPLDEDDLAAPPLSTRESVQVLRILDAAANRAREGLRVVEDYVRFVLDDPFLTQKLKEWRHELTEVLGCIPSTGRMAARETTADVGTRITTPGETSRRAPEDVLTANFKRLQESLRSLEEYGKLFRADLAARVEQLRYRTYTLHRAAAITRTSLDRLEDVRLYVLLDGRESMEEFERLARVLIDNGVDAIQLRDKTLDDRTLLARARRLRKLTRRGDALFIVNDRPDIAALAHADGVHVGQEELSAKDARTVVGPDALVGVSTHSIEQAREAVLSGANYIGVGPTFPSRTKQFDEFPGIALLDAVVSEIRLPAFAIGGIDTTNLSRVLGTGIRRIAVGGAVLGASDPAATTRMLANRLRR